MEENRRRWKGRQVIAKKVLWKKVFANKKSLKIKSYHFETLFSRTFFWFQIFYKKSPLIVENAWKQRIFTTIEKRLDIKNTPGYIRHADLYMKSPFYENVSDLIFPRLRNFFLSCFSSHLFSLFAILFPETLLAAPILI